jgi:UDP-glucose 4-epimerase
MEGASKTILITWGLGYIWSHTCTVFLEEDYDIIIVDNLSNSDLSVLDKIKEITWRKPKFYNIDIRDIEEFEKVFKNHPNIDGVIHFAAKKAVWESCQDPFLYYENNIIGTHNLLKLMQKYDKKNIVFSSSATVYDAPKLLPPFSENDRVGTYNPYGTTKLIMEYMLKDLANFKWFNVVNLRYFNPIWAHGSGLIWEDPKWVPNNLVPYILKVGNWEIENVQIFWDDYDTEDWTWVRDYVHVMDVSEAHLSAYRQILKYNEHKEENNIDINKWYFDIFNIWTWDGKSVKEVIELVNKVTEKEIPYVVVSRRPGDIDISIANAQKARQVLGWEYNRSMYQAIEDARRFIQSQNN